MAEAMADFDLDEDFDAQAEIADPDAEEIEVDESVETPAAPMAMTADQMQQMLDRQAEQFKEQQQQNMQLVQQALTPRQQQELVQPPDPAAMLKAIQEGDAEEFLKLQNQKDLATEQRHQLQLQRLEQAGAARFQEVNTQLLDTAVPEYTKHKDAVNKQMDELGLSPDLRSNPKIVEILTRAEAGRSENIEEEIRRRQQEQRRRANDTQVEGPGGTTRRQTQRQAQEQPSVFSPDGLQAFAYAGKDPDDFARKMGHDSWEAYQASAAELLGQDTVTTHKFMKGREAEFRGR